MFLFATNCQCLISLITMSRICTFCWLTLNQNVFFPDRFFFYLFCSSGNFYSLLYSTFVLPYFSPPVQWPIIACIDINWSFWQSYYICSFNSKRGERFTVKVARILSLLACLSVVKWLWYNAIIIVLYSNISLLTIFFPLFKGWPQVRVGYSFSFLVSVIYLNLYGTIASSCHGCSKQSSVSFSWYKLTFFVP